jgi:hypothetical protein
MQVDHSNRQVSYGIEMLRRCHEVEERIAAEGSRSGSAVFGSAVFDCQSMNEAVQTQAWL